MYLSPPFSPISVARVSLSSLHIQPMTSALATGDSNLLSYDSVVINVKQNIPISSVATQ